VDERIRALAALLEEHSYRGFDPFDLSNSPLLARVPRGWHLPNLVISKFGSRVAPDALRRVLRVPPIEDPKIYACAYFGYRMSGLPELAEQAEPMLDRLAAMAHHEDGTYWGYDYLWATRGSGVNPRGGSTLVPGSFALLALLHGMARTGDDRHAGVVRAALDHYATEHRSRGAVGEYLGYFPQAASNTHNANLLGCVALTMGGRLLGEERHLELAAECASTSVVAIGTGGYIPYSDHGTGDWTDCFHHLYVLASLKALGALNPHLPAAELADAAARLERYYHSEFERPDGLVNYYPRRLHPVDPHNYAATAIYLTLTGDAEAGRALLRRVDGLMWDSRLGRYHHRLHRRRRDKRFFLRWTQVWMLTALCVAQAGGAAEEEIERTRLALLAPVSA
jgi:hypothetical protein